MNNINSIINNLRQSVSSNPIIKFFNTDQNKKSGRGPIIFLIFSLLYIVYPFDLIPDVPFFGWFDDIILLVVAILNLVEKKVFYKYEYIRKTLNKIKWVIFIVGGSLVLIFVLTTLGALKLIIG